MIIYDGSNKELMRVRALEREGDDLIIKGKIFGAVPMTARLTPHEARAVLKLLTPSLLLFLLTFLFRSSACKASGARAA
jgi:hypothetical protein